MTALVIIALTFHLLCVMAFLVKLPKHQEDSEQFKQALLQDKDLESLVNMIFFSGINIVFMLAIDIEKMIAIHHIYIMLGLFISLTIFCIYRIQTKKIDDHKKMRNRFIAFLIYCVFCGYLLSIM